MALGCSSSKSCVLKHSSSSPSPLYPPLYSLPTFFPTLQLPTLGLLSPGPCQNPSYFLPSGSPSIIKPFSTPSGPKSTSTSQPHLYIKQCRDPCPFSYVHMSLGLWTGSQGTWGLILNLQLTSNLISFPISQLLLQQMGMLAAASGSRWCWKEGIIAQGITVITMTSLWGWMNSCDSVLHGKHGKAREIQQMPEGAECQPSGSQMGKYRQPEDRLNLCSGPCVHTDTAWRGPMALELTGRARVWGCGCACTYVQAHVWEHARVHSCICMYV